ncbi:hypothetical protein EBT31_03855, partial [bacterium]|nr:hypothetical protein [bacterium]
MAGGLMQLVAYGAQDVYLTGNPKVTFFQAVYKRHTNFAMEVIQQTVNGTPANSGRVSVTIARNGDLVGNMHVALAPALTVLGSSVTANLTSNNVAYDANWIAERAIAAVELTIGGQRIDKHFQTWWRLYAEVFLNQDNKTQYNKMTTAPAALRMTGTGTTPYRVYLPLLFFFNRNPGLYLPLIALQYHEVRLDFDLTSYFSNYLSTSIFEVWANYIYLDTEERRRFAQKGHEYLIEQVQHTGGDTIASGFSETSPQLIRLSFNHPVKELVWCYQNASPSTQLNSLWNFTTNHANVNVTVDPTLLGQSNVGCYEPQFLGAPKLLVGSNTIIETFKGTPTVSTTVYSAWNEEGNNAPALYEVGPLHQFKVILNGQDRFKEQYGRYFNQVQPFYHHSGNPYPGIYVYSFA